MKAYAIIKNTPYSAGNVEKFFTSKSKAIGYIIAQFKDEKPRGYEKEWFDSNWCYDTDELFNSKNWNKYKYVMDGGKTTLYIKQIDVL